MNAKSGISVGKKKRVFALHRDMDSKGALQNSAGTSRSRKMDSKMQEKFSDSRKKFNTERNSIRKVEEENVSKRKTLDQSGSKQKTEPFSRKKVQDKKNLGEFEQRPKKKKKQGIRIDPHDTSNKRLDDGVATKGQSLNHLSNWWSKVKIE